MMNVKGLEKRARSQETTQEELAELARRSIKLARLVARNPNAPESLLRELGAHKDKTVRKWVTTHPGTPSEVLLKLAQQFPEQLLDNPILDLLLLENPNLFADMPIGTVRSLMKRTKTPAGFIRYAAGLKDEGVQLALLQNANAPEEVITQLGRQGLSADIRDAALQHISQYQERTQSLEVADLLFWNALVQKGSRVSSISYEIYQRASIPEKVRWQLSMHWAARHDKFGINVRTQVAASPETPIEMLECLAGDPKSSVQKMAFQNPNCPAWIKDLRNGKPLVRKTWLKNVGEHTIIRKESFQNWISTDSPLTAYHILYHPASTAFIRRQILRSKILSDRMLILSAKDNAMPDDVLSALAQNDNNTVRYYVAKNTNTPKASLELLAKDENWEILEAIRKNRATPGCVLSDMANELLLTKTFQYGYKLCEIAKNHSTPCETLMLLANCDDDSYVKWHIDRGLAANPATPPECLERLSLSSDIFWIKGPLAHNSSTPPATLMKMAIEADRDDFIVEDSKINCGIANNPNTPVATLSKMAASKSAWIYAVPLARNRKTPEDALKQLLKKELKYYCNFDVFVKIIVMRRELSSIMSGEFLAEVDTDIREEIAKNVRTNTDILLSLTKDELRIVRRLAEDNLKSRNVTYSGNGNLLP